MTESCKLSRQVHLQELGRFTQTLLQALRLRGLTEEALTDLLTNSVVIQCHQCGFQPTAGGLLDLAAGISSSPKASAEATRLSQGYCARSGCDSYYYDVNLREHPDFEWLDILVGAQQIDRTDRERERATHLAAQAAKRSLLKRLDLRLGTGAAVVTGLLLLWQWYIGGRIPFVREPEPFEIDPASVGQRVPTSSNAADPGP